MHAAARRELFEAAERYDRDTPGAGKRLRYEVRHVGTRIRLAPHQGSPYLYGTRRFVLQRFPFSTVYLTLDAEGTSSPSRITGESRDTGAGG
jgi:hypothetical protein